MKVVIVILILLISGYSNVSAQDNISYGKLGASLKLFLAENPVASRFITEKNGVKTLSVIIQVDKNLDETLLVKKGLTIRTKMGDVVTADILLDNIIEIAGLNEIKRIELPLLFTRTDTTMKRFTTVDKVLNGALPLDKAYNGKNVVIGIIDDGIDVTHPDFYDSAGNLRIISAWNMDRNRIPPTGFSYGNEWSKDSMEYYAQKFNQGQITNSAMENLFGYCFHGTPVAGLAAGNRGVAPGADIVSVALTALGDTLLRSDRVLDGIKYIYNKAKASGKKCVINISLGIMEGGPHDGKTLVEKAIDNFCEEKSDLLVCTSAGNNGNTWKHWGGFPIHRDSSYCFFRSVYTGSLYFCVPKQFSNTLSLSFTDSKPSNINSPNILPDSILGQTPYIRIADLINSNQPVSYITRLRDGSTSSSFTLSASHYNDEYDEVVVKVQEFTSNGNNFDFHLYRFIWKGVGTVHAWFPFFNLHPQFIFNNNPYPNDSTFRMSDNEYTTVIPTHAFTVLSSGAYNIRNCYVNITNKVINQYEKCRTAYFTSRGPTLDGRIKPDIITPGDNVMSSRKRFDSFFGFDFIMDANTISFGGTSASSPISAGIAALIWEKFPTISRTEIINKIKTTANFDNWSAAWGNQPNNVVGWGKADAFKAMTGVATNASSSCSVQDVCVSPNPPPPPPVNPTQSPNLFKIYPSPANNILNILYTSNEPLIITLYDAAGRLLIQNYLPSRLSPSSWQINTTIFAAGVYIIKATGVNNSIVKKILIIH